MSGGAGGWLENDGTSDLTATCSANIAVE